MENALRDHGEEMVEVLEKSVKYWQEESYGALDRETLLKRIELVRRNGPGLWSQNEMMEVGSWFRDALRR